MSRATRGALSRKAAIGQAVGCAAGFLLLGSVPALAQSFTAPEH